MIPFRAEKKFEGVNYGTPDFYIVLRIILEHGVIDHPLVSGCKSLQDPHPGRLPGGSAVYSEEKSVYPDNSEYSECRELVAFFNRNGLIIDGVVERRLGYGAIVSL